MKRNIFIRLSVVIGILALAGSASGALSVEDQVKKLAARYAQVEDQLARSVRYASRNDKGDSEQAWFNGADDLIKLAVESRDGNERKLTEYFALDFDNDYDGMFMLVRKETPLPDGGTRVDESRKYFGDVVIRHEGLNETGTDLIRELRKSARFKAGESTDTVGAPNAIVDLTKKSNQMSEDELREIMLAPTKMAEELRKGAPESDPFANIKGDSDKYRVIHGSASPDGRFAIALGFAREKIDWDALYDKELESYYAEGGAEDIRNYVVDLAKKKILGQTGAGWIGTRRRYNHPECVVTWSPDSSFFMQLLANKWSSDDCVAGKIASGPKFIGAVNLLKTLTPRIYAFVKKRFDSEEGGSLSFHINKVSNDGTIDLEASQYCSSGDCKGETEFAVNERLRLSDGAKGPRIEILKMRRLPNER
jgi:hypothetical protein